MTPRTDLNVLAQTALLQKAFSDVASNHDVFHNGDSLAETYCDGQHVACVARIDFNATPNDRTVVLNIYANGMFHVASAVSGTTRDTIAAYARAHQVITLFDLKDLR